MRNRFFLTTFLVLISVSIGTVAIYAYFLKADRLRLIDQQVRETASSLVDSELSDLRKINFDAADDIISDELGDSRFGKFFVIRNEKDEVIYRSPSAELPLLRQIPQTPQWIRLDHDSTVIRVLNLKLPRVRDRTLQVGVVIDKSLIAFDYFSFATLMVFITVLTIGFIVSWFVSSFLMRPISRLETFLSSASQGQTALFPPLPIDLRQGASLSSKDEFMRLTSGLSEMIDKVNRNYRSSRLWSYQMAHELKTPLTLMQINAERIERDGANPKNTEPMLSEITRMNDIIQSFLSWAELENSSMQKYLFANKLSRLFELEIGRLSSLFPGRIVLRGDSNPTLLANPQHLEQLLHNLLVNALEYSPNTEQVTVEISDQSFSIIDRGPGIPDDVIKRLGEPFNQGVQGTKKQRSHGLGLAWARTITRLYGWRLELDSTSKGSIAKVSFS